MEGTKTVFVSGSNRGTGKAVVNLFALRGWNVIAHARRSSEDFIEFTKKLSIENNVTVTPIFFDMQDETAMKEQVKNVIAVPKINVNALVNNAGICEIKLFMMTSLNDIQKTFDVNFFSHLRLTQLLLKRMPKGSVIINVASIDALQPKRGESAYAASKAALLAWTEVLRQELIGRVRVNAVAPSAVNTDMAKNLEEKADWKGQKIIEPESIAKAIYFLAEDEAADITGDVLKITGSIL